MGNSLGYIQERDADAEILAEAYRLLRPEGWLLVDATDGFAVKNSLICDLKKIKNCARINESDKLIRNILL